MCFILSHLKQWFSSLVKDVDSTIRMVRNTCHVFLLLFPEAHHLVLQNPETYPQGKEKTYPAKGVSAGKSGEVAQVVAQEWQNEAQEHKEKLNEVWKLFREKKLSNANLGWESEEFGGRFGIRFANPLKMKKNKTSG